MRTPTLLATALLGLCTHVHAQSLNDLMNAFGESSKVRFEEDKTPYKPLGFTGSYRWEVHSFENGTPNKDNPVNIVLAFDDAHMAMEPNTGSGQEKMRMVFDLKNKHTYTLLTDKKGQRNGIKTKSMRIVVEDDAQKDSDTGKLTRTNETKSIDGHTCRKFTFSNEDGHGEAWVVEDIKFNAFEALGHMMGAKADGWQKAPYQGMVMQSTWVKKDGKEKVEVFTRDLVVGKVDKARFSTEGYSIQDLSNMSLFGQ